MSDHQVRSPASVDVAIPCYQYGRFLRDCVTSVLTQAIRDVRVLIIDNASTDDSVEVALQIATEDPRVEVIARQRNLGPHASFNEGIDWASATYFMVLCADDLLAPGALAPVVSFMERHPDVGFAYGRAASLFPGQPMPALDSSLRDAPWRIVLGRDLLEQFCRDGVNHIPGPSTVVVRTVAQKAAGYYRPALPHTDDFEMWMRLALIGHAARTEAELGILRFHGSARSAAARRVQTVPYHQPPAMPWHDEAAFESFFVHEGALLPEAMRLHRLARRSLGERAYWAALAHLSRGQLGTSRDLLKFAFSRRPATAILPPVRYLFRRQNGLRRVIEVASEMVRWSRPSRAAARAGG
jgi:glycosyltransferase involved in cell wall biosynthesis